MLICYTIFFWDIKYLVINDIHSRNKYHIVTESLQPGWCYVRFLSWFNSQLVVHLLYQPSLTNEKHINVKWRMRCRCSINWKYLTCHYVSPTLFWSWPYLWNRCLRNIQSCLLLSLKRFLQFNVHTLCRNGR